MKIRRKVFVVLIVVLGTASVFGQHDHDYKPTNVAGKGSTVREGKTGILLLAHGGKENWNEEVRKIGSVVDQSLPVEIAFGMASKRSIQQAVDKLTERGVTEVVAVPLFVSSHSSVITSTEYLLGLRKEAPAAVAVFAKMDHGQGDHGLNHPVDTGFDSTKPIKTSLPVRILSALNRHPLVAEILLSRAGEISLQPKKEVVIVVAHGPVSDQENNLWLADMSALADRMRAASNFRRIEYLTVRDDAPDPIRSRATTELRRTVEKAASEGSRVLIVPLLLSYGGIEEGIRKRLEGLEYTMSTQALLPDPRLARWVLESVKNTTGKR
ncbi:MAG: CbiX/SirB N-terminal domain-containing protein [Pyrinomonadaceae bacterium]